MFVSQTKRWGWVQASVWIAVAAVSGALSPNEAVAQSSTQATVVRVVDGATLEAQLESGEVHGRSLDRG